MNALNILSARVIGSTPPQTPATTRRHSYSDPPRGNSTVPVRPRQASTGNLQLEGNSLDDEKRNDTGESRNGGKEVLAGDTLPANEENEKSPLIASQSPRAADRHRGNRIWLLSKGLANVLSRSLKWVLSTLAAPGVYLVTCFYDERQQFSPLLPARRLVRVLSHRNGQRSTAHAVGLSAAPGQRTVSSSGNSSKSGQHKKHTASSRRSSAGSTSSTMTSESELDTEQQGSASQGKRGTSRSTRSKSQTTSGNGTPSRRSIRIKLYNEDSLKQRKGKNTQAATPETEATNAISVPTRTAPVTPANLKSPTSPTSSLRLTRYPRAPAPPRPLIPRRQPSYTSIHPSSSKLAQKTLILDLDETLIHSLAKGGRMSTGHMVEVRLNTPVGFSGGTAGPQHPILYYVHKRPHCDDFLRKVCKWYNLVVFTASVQEYADPVIDWLEQERKFFSSRLYRQHCTFRNGAYIKDLSTVEADLSKVMILDNSPMSYIFHEDNAIPIEGWINDPTDNDLLHLIPLLEGLQYVTDVRALLALRMGEAAT
ncbi:MAG: Nuclear envelope morphology protein 1 [Candelina submexicana]|nr:MAG: Nuclear envelope morphology protein 1 [Candelina submexicana]